MRHNHHLQLTALLAAMASVYPLQALANAGITQFSVGDVSVQRATSSTPLASGSRIESGDLITTGNTGRTQLRFTDGGLVSLQPNSQFKISRYTDAGDGKQDSFLVDLARGGMRALTGLIGKRNRENYKVTTSTATIGIRGSGFSMAYNSDGTLGVTTEQDAIEVCTQAGCIGLNLGESALVTSAGALPTRTNQRALWNPPNPRRLIAARNDDVDSEGKTATIKRVVAGLAFTGAGITVEESTNGPRLYLNGATAITNTGESLGYRAQSNDQGSGGNLIVQQTSGSLQNGDFMAIGTWDNAIWSGSNPATLVQSGFVVGQPTPENAIASAAGLRGKYDLTAGTPVYTNYGANGTLLSTSHVIVDFRSAFGAMDINLDLNLPSNNQYLQPSASSTSSSGGMTHNLRGSATATGAGFSGTLGASDAYGNLVGNGAASGFLGGSQAGTLGLSYTADIAYYGSVAGAGMFTRGTGGAIPASTLSNDGFKLHVLDGSDYFYTNEYNSNNVLTAGEGVANFTGTQLTRWAEYSCANCDQVISQTPQNATPARLYGSVGQPTESNFLGWGSWAAGTLESDGTQNLTDVHYIVGTPTSYLPYLGTASYGLIGGTVPTSTQGGNGQLLSTSNLQVDFGNQSLTANINLQFGSTNASFSQSGAISGSSFRSNGCGNNFFSGFFSGNNGSRAGLVYGTNNHPTLGNIRGAAAFQQTSFNPSNIAN